MAPQQLGIEGDRRESRGSRTRAEVHVVEADDRQIARDAHAALTGREV